MYRRLAALLLLLVSALAAADDLETEVKRFVDAYAILEKEAADPVSRRKRSTKAQSRPVGVSIRHSVFFDPEQFGAA